MAQRREEQQNLLWLTEPFTATSEALGCGAGWREVSFHKLLQMMMAKCWV